MKTFTYNDTNFLIDKTGGAWNILRVLPDGTTPVFAAGLYAGLPDDEAEAGAEALIKTIFPVGVKIFGPDFAHPNKVGDLKIVGPNLRHPNFIHWNKDSTSFSK